MQIYRRIFLNNEKGRNRMGKTIGILIGLLLATVGVIMIFDARLLTKKFFSFGDQNEATMGIKLFGFFFSVVGGILILWNG